MEGCGLPEILEDRKVRKLRAAICTNLCRERLGGILEIMEHGYNVTEYWLPEGVELLLEKARRFNGDWENWLHLAMGSKGTPPSESTTEVWTDLLNILPRDSARRHMEGTAVLIALGMTVILGRPLYAHLSRDVFCQRDDDSPDVGLTTFFTSTLELLADRAATRWHDQEAPISRIIKRMGWRLFHGGTPEDLAMLCGRLLLAEADLLPGGEERGVRSTISALALTAMTGALMTKTPAKLKFMANAGQQTDTLIPQHPIKCINGHISDNLSRLPAFSTPQTILQQARRLSGHKEELVYQYGDKNCSVLFCSDTRMPFFSKGEALHLDRPTIITAPRQGGLPSERAYAHIRSADTSKDIWVRAHFSNTRHISSCFKAQANKICLNNCQDIALQEILLRYTDNQWTIIAGGQCACG